jgi:hypothetical protein
MAEDDDDDLLSMFDERSGATGAGRRASGWQPGGAGSSAGAGWTPGGTASTGSGSGWTPGGSGASTRSRGSSDDSRRKARSKTGKQSKEDTMGERQNHHAGISGVQTAPRLSKSSTTAQVPASASATANETSYGDDEFEISGNLGTDDSVMEVAEDSGSKDDAPGPRASRGNVHFGIAGLEAAVAPAPASASATANETSYGDDEFEISGNLGTDDSVMEVAEDSGSKDDAPGPRASRGNVHFGIAGLEAADLPRSASSSVPSNVHFGIAGLQAAEVPSPAPVRKPSNVHFGIGALEAAVLPKTFTEQPAYDDTRGFHDEDSIAELSAMDESIGEHVHEVSPAACVSHLSESVASASSDAQRPVKKLSGLEDRQGQGEIDEDEYYSSEFEPSQNTLLDASAAMSQDVPDQSGHKSSSAAALPSRSGSKSARDALSTPVSQWAVGDVCKWLSDVIGLPEAAQKAQRAAVDGLLLIHLSEAEVQVELGVERALHRKKLMLHIDRLRVMDVPRTDSWAACPPRRADTHFVSERAQQRLSPAMPADVGLSAELESLATMRAASVSLLKTDLERIRTTAMATRNFSRLLLSTLEQRKDTRSCTLKNTQAEISAGRRKMDTLIEHAKQWISQTEGKNVPNKAYERKLAWLDKAFEAARPVLPTR